MAEVRIANNDGTAAEIASGSPTLNVKTFSTGSRGYNAVYKAMVNGERCQVNVNAVVIGSKPGAVAAAPKGSKQRPGPATVAMARVIQAVIDTPEERKHGKA